MSEYDSTRTGSAHDNDDARIAALESLNLQSQITTLLSTILSLLTTISTLLNTITNLSNSLTLLSSKINIMDLSTITNVTSTVVLIIESSFQNASNYSLFSGTTMNAEEAGWYGYKHTTSKKCYGIFFSHSHGVTAMCRNTSGLWTFRRLGYF